MPNQIDAANRGRWFLSLLSSIVAGAVTPPGMPKMQLLPSEKNAIDAADTPYFFVRLYGSTSDIDQKKTSGGVRPVMAEQKFYIAAGIKGDNGLNTVTDELLCDLEDAIEGAMQAAIMPGNTNTWARSFDVPANGGLSAYPHTVAVQNVFFPTEAQRDFLPPQITSLNAIYMFGKIIYSQTSFAGQL